MILRPARPEDAGAIAAIHRRAAFFPPRRSAPDHLDDIREQLMRTHHVRVADTGGEVLGYIAFNADWIVHLFVRPDCQGRGLGQALLAAAMSDGRARQLWTFEKNLPARRFYEARGWTLAETTDGRGNEDREPEVRYRSP